MTPTSSAVYNDHFIKWFKLSNCCNECNGVSICWYKLDRIFGKYALPIFFFVNFGSYCFIRIFFSFYNVSITFMISPIRWVCTREKHRVQLGIVEKRDGKMFFQIVLKLDDISKNAFSIPDSLMSSSTFSSTRVATPDFGSFQRLATNRLEHVL